MLPILIVLGATGALLEFKRLIDRPPKEGDLCRLQRSEEQLKRVLQEIQRELQQEKSEHELDQAKLNELKQADLELRRVHQEILARKDQELQQKALEYTHLTEKVEELEIQHEEESRRRTEKFEAEIEVLKHDIASAFEQFSNGNMSAENLLDNVSNMGVEVQLTAEDLKSAVAAASCIASGRRDAKQLQLQVDSEWRSQLRLLSDDPERMARSLAERAHRAGLPSIGASASNFPTVKTPPKDRKEANLFSNVPAISLPSFGTSATVDKESLQNVSESFKKATLKAAVTEPLQAATTAGNRRMDGMIAIDSKKVPSPVKTKKRSNVPRLGLSMVLKNAGSDKPSNRDTFALGDLGNDDDEHRMLNRSIV